MTLFHSLPKFIYTYHSILVLRVLFPLLNMSWLDDRFYSHTNNPYLKERKNTRWQNLTIYGIRTNEKIQKWQHWTMFQLWHVKNFEVLTWILRKILKQIENSEFSQTHQRIVLQSKLSPWVLYRQVNTTKHSSLSGTEAAGA